MLTTTEQEKNPLALTEYPKLADPVISHDFKQLWKFTQGESRDTNISLETNLKK